MHSRTEIIINMAAITLILTCSFICECIIHKCFPRTVSIQPNKNIQIRIPSNNSNSSSSKWEWKKLFPPFYRAYNNLASLTMDDVEHYDFFSFDSSFFISHLPLWCVRRSESNILFTPTNFFYQRPCDSLRAACWAHSNTVFKIKDGMKRTLFTYLQHPNSK